jgi:serine protease DegS
MVYLQYQALQPSTANRAQLLPSAQFSTSTPGFAEAVELALPSVVNVYTSRIVPSESHPLLNDPLFRRFMQRNRTPQQNKIVRSLGSGVIVRSDGYILTNHHVINAADSIQILLSDGRVKQASVIGTDVATDLAVLKIGLKDLTPAQFAVESTVRVGDVALAIGNPYGIGTTVTQGIVSATGRHGLRLNTYENYIQTDAAINEGNSGGALVNAHGKLIGINSSLYSKTGSSAGIGFAIPNEVAIYVLDRIIADGIVIRGWLGITAEAITPAIASTFKLNNVSGLVLTNVMPEGPAAAAGLQSGDIITHIDNIAAGDGNRGMHQVAKLRPGSQITIRAIRMGAEQSFLLTVGRRPMENSS